MTPESSALLDHVTRTVMDVSVKATALMLLLVIAVAGILWIVLTIGTVGKSLLYMVRAARERTVDSAKRSARDIAVCIGTYTKQTGTLYLVVLLSVVMSIGFIVGVAGTFELSPIVMEASESLRVSWVDNVGKPYGIRMVAALGLITIGYGIEHVAEYED